MSTRSASLVLAAAAIAGCHREPPGGRFPSAQRDVAPIVSDAFSTEDARDRAGEAEMVTHLAGIRPGMQVADIGAGEGYYTVRLAPVVGRRGRVLAEDIVPETRDALAERAQRENLDNVAVRLGLPDDPRLPASSFDRVFMVHMYHEVSSPYAFLWHMRDGLRPQGEAIVVDADRPTRRHGTPPDLLKCEFASVGLKMVRFERMAGTDSYFAAFSAAATKPAPGAIKPCTEARP